MSDLAPGYEFVSARWANAAQTAAEVMTAEYGAVMVTMERPNLWLRLQDFIHDDGNTVADFVAPPPADDTPEFLRAEFEDLKQRMIAAGVISADLTRGA